ncbi:MAG: thioredoxin family protein [Saprospiraceae bacterium]|nr:thioredoxin family protein [Saprospiraceae bacterium]
MKTLIRSICVFSVLLFHLSMSGNNRETHQAVKSIEEARQIAVAEGKLIFVDFSAKWCAPCRWMDQTTYNDKQIVRIMEESFVQLRVDIDDISGFEMKKQFSVKYLPTIIILNAQGQMLERIEETVTPRVLASILDKHKSGAENNIVRHDVNSSPSAKKEALEYQNAELLMTSEDFLRYFHQNLDQKAYRIQSGVFSSYESADTQVKFFREKYSEPVNVVNEVHDGKVVFRVLVGQFFKEEEAEQFRTKLLKESSISGIVI